MRKTASHQTSPRKGVGGGGPPFPFGSLRRSRRVYSLAPGSASSPARVGIRICRLCRDQSANKKTCFFFFLKNECNQTHQNSCGTGLCTAGGKYKIGAEVDQSFFSISCARACTVAYEVSTEAQFFADCKLHILTRLTCFGCQQFLEKILTFMAFPW